MTNPNHPLADAIREVTAAVALGLWSSNRTRQFFEVTSHPSLRTRLAGTGEFWIDRPSGRPCI